MIYPMESFDEIMGDASPFDIAKMVAGGEFNPKHDFFGLMSMGI